jgi:hypothetical protein
MWISPTTFQEPRWNSANGVGDLCAPSTPTSSATLAVSAIVAATVGGALLKKTEVNYTIVRGEVWERLLVIKDKRTHRKRVPTEAAATIKVGDVLYSIPVEVTSEGGVLMTLSAGNTEWLAAGEYQWDMVATVSRSALLTSTPLSEMLVVYGTLAVVTYDNLTPMESDGVTEALSVVS